jgi:epoxide hydrolase-like predicted phosphatase
MTIKAIYFDMGGVIVRTEFQAPRQHLAERFGLDYDEIGRLVFDSPSSLQATLGAISEDEQWAAVAKKLRQPATQAPAIRDEFFGGDIPDIVLIDFLRELRKTFKVGLISNAWSGARAWIEAKKLADAFDALIISAEERVAKPDERIYRIALEKLGVAPAEAVFVDDFKANVEAARAIGMQAIHFTQPENALDELKKLLDIR